MSGTIDDQRVAKLQTMDVLNPVLLIDAVPLTPPSPQRGEGAFLPALCTPTSLFVLLKVCGDTSVDDIGYDL